MAPGVPGRRPDPDPYFHCVRDVQELEIEGIVATRRAIVAELDKE